MILGLGFRAINLDQKAYWVDEVHTAVRIAGYTKADITAERFDNQIHTVEELNTYQVPTAEPSLLDVVKTLAQHPEHPPLYYLLSRWWMQAAMSLGLSPSIAITRSLSLLFSGLTLLGVWGLCRELFRSKQTAIIALTIVAVSPLHVLYGQEAREYSLWTLMTILSCWAFLRAMRQPTANRWIIYGLTLVVGWYSHLLFATVAIAQTLYFSIILGGESAKGPATMLSTEKQKRPALQSSSNQATHGLFQGSLWGAFMGTMVVSLLCFSPWIWVFLNQWGQVQNVVDATQRDPSFGYLVNVWGRNLSRVWFSADLGIANSLGVLGVGYALVYLWRTVPKPISGLILLLISVNALSLMVPDMVTGGISSTRIRYLLPAYLGIQLAIAHLLSHRLLHAKGWSRRVWAGLMAGIFAGGAIAGIFNTQRVTNWAKSDKSLYYPQMAAVINASPKPLVITDNSATYTLVLANQLNPSVHLQLVDLQRLDRPKDLSIPEQINRQPISDIFLFAPSPPLRRLMERKQPGGFESVVRQSDRFQLLRQK